LFHKSSELSYYLPPTFIDPSCCSRLPELQNARPTGQKRHGFKCDTCKRLSHQDEIPVMLIDEATIEQ
jgi:hypothetical protein